MLLDGNGLIYRGYFALPPLTTSKGELVNAVFGFCSIVLRGIADIKPDYVAVAFDLQGPTFRHEQYAEYKATRQRMPAISRSASKDPVLTRTLISKPNCSVRTETFCKPAIRPVCCRHRSSERFHPVPIMCE